MKRDKGYAAIGWTMRQFWEETSPNHRRNAMSRPRLQEDILKNRCSCKFAFVFVTGWLRTPCFKIPQLTRKKRQRHPPTKPHRCSHGHCTVTSDDTGLPLSLHGSRLSQRPPRLAPAPRLLRSPPGPVAEMRSAESSAPGMGFRGLKEHESLTV